MYCARVVSGRPCRGNLVPPARYTLLSIQRTLTDLQTRQFAATVQLIRALGGEWDTTLFPK